MNEQKLKMLEQEKQKVLKQFKIAQICRNQFVIDYVLGVLSNLKDDEALYKHNIRRKINLVEKFADKYNIALNDYMKRETLSSRGESIDEDTVRDAAYQYHRHIKQHVYYYEQGVMRILGHLKIQAMQTIGVVTVAKDLAALIAVINGHEQNAAQGELEVIAGLGGVNRMKVKDQERAGANTIAWLSTMLSSILCDLLAMENRTKKMTYECRDDSEIGRIMIQTGEKLTQELLWTSYFRALAEKNCTAEEAVEVAKKIDCKLMKRKAELEAKMLR